MDPTCATAVVDLPTAVCSDDEEDADEEESDSDHEEQEEEEEICDAMTAERAAVWKGRKNGTGIGRRSDEEVGLLDHQEPDLDLEQEAEGDVASSESEFGEDDAAKTCEVCVFCYVQAVCGGCYLCRW